MNSLVLSLIATLIISPLVTCEFVDTITPNKPIKDGDVLLSSQHTFALGFFSLGNSQNRYVGIWYHKIPQQTVVWVANRDNPINDTTGVLAIDGHRGLVLDRNDTNSPVWSSNVTVPLSSNSMAAKLLDTGNFVLLADERVIWEGFDYPTDTFLPYMKLGLDLKTGFDRFLTSWKSPEDPGTGNCSYRMDPTGYPQLFMHKDGALVFRTGSWTGVRWSGVPRMGNTTTSNTSFVNNQDEITVMYNVNSDSTVLYRLVIDETGILSRLIWQNGTRSWSEFWHAPDDWCDSYAKCGRNSNCDPSDASKFECKCLPGYEPQTETECTRKWGGCEKGEGFVPVRHVKLPDTRNARVETGVSFEACHGRCLGDCNCSAYTSADERDGGIGCLMWHGDLTDTRTFTGMAGLELFVRVDAVTLAEYARVSKSSGTKARKLGISLSLIVMFLVVVFITYRFVMKKTKEETESKHLFHSSRSYLEELKIDESVKESNIPLLDLNTIVIATSNFSYENKLGQGGFGDVYKGLLSDGREIAVKRLSKCSHQGDNEFKNEVMLISKLQHRNLVKILGCCVQNEEKMLVYEYLPNKSLDFFIFDETRRKMLDWKKRFHIICGIARGMCYLHQDSRLRVIHRDLKASNILLDSSMNPKISDFGLARIFGGDQIEACTKRVVGTYGYMSPEYAMEGLISTKSDVYSFGVLLLEIVTGRKKIGYCDDNDDSNLIAHIWESWKESKVHEVVDSTLDDLSYGEAITRCVQIGLLCVQDNPTHRPSMTTIVSMLGNDSTLPSPKKPDFVCNISYKSVFGVTSTSEGPNSLNIVTCTTIEAR